MVENLIRYKSEKLIEEFFHANLVKQKQNFQIICEFVAINLLEYWYRKSSNVDEKFNFSILWNFDEFSLSFYNRLTRDHDHNQFLINMAELSSSDKISLWDDVKVDINNDVKTIGEMRNILEETNEKMQKLKLTILPEFYMKSHEFPV